MSKACIDCGQIIPKERLSLIPAAQRCLACQNEYEQSHEFRRFADEGLAGSRADNKKLRDNISEALRKRPWE